MNSAITTERIGFVTVATLDRLPIGEPVAAHAAGHDLCLLRTDSAVLVFEDRCPHRGHPLSAGKCERGVLRCALHGWEFGLPAGEAVSPRAPFGLQLVESRVVGNAVEAAL